MLSNIKKVVALAEDEVRRGEYEEICNRNVGDSESQLTKSTYDKIRETTFQCVTLFRQKKNL